MRDFIIVFVLWILGIILGILSTYFINRDDLRGTTLGHILSQVNPLFYFPILGLVMAIFIISFTFIYSILGKSILLGLYFLTKTMPEYVASKIKVPEIIKTKINKLLNIRINL